MRDRRGDEKMKRRRRGNCDQDKLYEKNNLFLIKGGERNMDFLK